MISVVLELYSQRKNTKTTFLDDKFSKAKFIELNASQKNPHDIIFIGNSQTFYHISTNFFKKNGINISNFGVSARRIPDFGFMVKKAITLHPKHMVIAIPIDELFHKPYITTSPTLDDIKNYFDTRQDPFFIFEEIVNYIRSFDRLWPYSPAIYLQLQILYHDFDNALNRRTTMNIRRSSKKAPDNSLMDCVLYSVNYSKAAGAIIKCTNGDGVLLGNKVEKDCKNDPNALLISNGHLNSNTLALLNLYISSIRANNITPIIIFNTSYCRNFHYNLDSVTNSINAKVLDLTFLKIPDAFWQDRIHFNDKGRMLYSKILLDKLVENGVKAHTIQ